MRDDNVGIGIMIGLLIGFLVFGFGGVYLGVESAKAECEKRVNGGGFEENR